MDWLEENGWIIPPATDDYQTALEELDSSVRPIPGALAADELVQLAVNHDRNHPRMASHVEVKKDGIRSLFIGGGHKLIVTREGQPMACAGRSLDGLRRLEKRFGQPMVFDMEYQAGGSFEESLSAFRAERQDGLVWVFDALPLAAWMKNACSEPYYRRKFALEAAAKVRRIPRVGFLLGKEVESQGWLEITAEEMWRHGEEGLVRKDSHARYWRGRAPTWMKIKQEITSEAMIIGLGENGGIICRADNLAEFVIPLAGKARQTVRSHQNPIGLTVEYIHAGATANGVPREARFHRLRTDLRSRG